MQNLKTNHHKLEIVDDGDIRKLLSGTGSCCEQGAIDLTDLRKHVYDFTLMAMYSLCFVPNPVRVLVVGLGVGVFPRELSFYRSDTVFDVIEIDSHVVDVAYSHFFYRDNKCQNPMINTIVGDAWSVIGSLEGEYDLVFIDAFTDSYIPYHLMCAEFLEAIKNRLSPQGVVAANMANVHPSYSSQIKTYQSVFGDNIYSLIGTRNLAATMLFVAQTKLEPSTDLNLPPQYYPPFQPSKVNFTPEIENSLVFKIFSV